MAVVDPSFDESGFDAWVETRPASVQEMARRVRYNRWYLMKQTNQRCYLYSYSEDGTVTVDVAPRGDGFDIFPFGHRVFGVDPTDLEECEAP